MNSEDVTSQRTQKPGPKQTQTNSQERFKRTNNQACPLNTLPTRTLVNKETKHKPQHCQSTLVSASAYLTPALLPPLHLNRIAVGGSGMGKGLADPDLARSKRAEPAPPQSIPSRPPPGPGGSKEFAISAQSSVD
jgi:hypothetical protein